MRGESPGPDCGLALVWRGVAVPTEGSGLGEGTSNTGGGLIRLGGRYISRDPERGQRPHPAGWARDRAEASGLRRPELKLAAWSADRVKHIGHFVTSWNRGGYLSLSRQRVRPAQCSIATAMLGRTARSRARHDCARRRQTAPKGDGRQRPPRSLLQARLYLTGVISFSPSLNIIQI